MTVNTKTTINRLPASAVKAIALDTLFGDYGFDVVVRTAETLIEWNNTRENDEIGKLIEQLNNRAWAMFEAEVTK
jgi:predicted HAD superfamily phosphohydrolase YqeG